MYRALFLGLFAMGIGSWLFGAGLLLSKKIDAALVFALAAYVLFRPGAHRCGNCGSGFVKPVS